MRGNKDEDFLVALREQDTPGIQAIYRAWFPAVKAWILRNRGTDTEARDMFQDALLVLYVKVRSGDFKLEIGLRPLFFTICRNLWLKELRKKSRTEVTLSALDGQIEGDDEEVEEVLQQRNRIRLFQLKLNELHKNCQQILRLSWEGKSMREIVQLLNLSSEGYGRKRKHQCKEQLVKLIQNDPLYQELKKS